MSSGHNGEYEGQGFIELRHIGLLNIGDLRNIRPRASHACEGHVILFLPASTEAHAAVVRRLQPAAWAQDSAVELCFCSKRFAGSLRLRAGSGFMGNYNIQRQTEEHHQRAEQLDTAPPLIA